MLRRKSFGLVFIFFCWQRLCWRYNLSHSFSVSASNGLDFQYLLDDVSLCIKRNSSTEVSEEIDTKDSVKNKKSKRRKSANNKNKMFALFYGYYAVEVVNALSNDQILKIMLLADCLTEEEGLSDAIVNLTSNTTAFSSPEHQRYLRYIPKSSDVKLSVTYLNGYLQFLLPDVHRSILIAANHGIRKAHWNSDEGQEESSTEYPDIDELGIRTIQLHTIDAPGIADFYEKLKQKVIDRENSKAFVVGGAKPPPPPLPTLQELQQDPDSEEYAAAYLQQHYSSSSRATGDGPEGSAAETDPANGHGDGIGGGEGDDDGDGSSYTLIFLMNDRSEFIGGEVWVSNEEITPAVDPNEPVERAPHGSLVTKFTPEKGSLVLAHSGSGRLFGHGPMVVGRRSMLVVELWPFKDAPPGTRRPALTEALSFSPSHDFILEL